MSNTLLTIDMITLEALAVLQNQLTFTGQIRRKYDRYFAKSGAKIGDTLRVRKPVRYLGRTGQGYTPEAVTETYVNVPLTTQKGVDFDLSSEELTLKIDEFSDRCLKPAIARIANFVDDDGLQLYLQLNQQVGTPGTANTTLENYLRGMAVLDEAAAPNDGDRHIVVSADQQFRLVNGLVTYFNPQQSIATQYKKGIMGMAAGAMFHMDQNTAAHTIGSYVGATPLTNYPSAFVNGSATIVTDGWTSVSANAGDVIQVAGVFSVNPQNYRSTGRLMSFVVTTAVSGTTDITFAVSPALIGPGSPFQNVSALPADGAAITVFGVSTMANVTGLTSPQALGFHPDFATLVSADLIVPKGCDMAGSKGDDQLGLAMRFIRDYDGTRDQMINRFDILYGWAVLRQELAVRICS